MRPNILVTNRVFSETITQLEPEADVDYAAGLTPEELVVRSRGKHGVLSQVTDRLSREVLVQIKDIGIIAHIGVGYDNIDVAAASELGILVTNTPGVLEETTADLAFGLMLAAARRIPEGHQFIHAGKWNRWSIDLMAGLDVHHRTLGILGMGRIGKAVARRALGFAMPVLYNNRNPLPPDVERELNARFVSKEELLAESDFLSIHTPLNPSTRYLIGEGDLRRMKPTAMLINTSRGPVVDEAALVKALEQRWIAGAGLDVFEREPEVHAGLLALPNVVMMPHAGSSSVATRTRMAQMAAENLLAALSGRRPANLVNPAIWDRWDYLKAR